MAMTDEQKRQAANIFVRYVFQGKGGDPRKTADMGRADIYAALEAHDDWWSRKTTQVADRTFQQDAVGNLPEPFASATSGREKRILAMAYQVAMSGFFGKKM